MRLFSSSVLLILVSSVACLCRGANARGMQSNVEQRTVAGKEVPSERDEQEPLFNYYFQDQKLKYETKLSDLKKEASVPAWRMPYSADIHPQSARRNERCRRRRHAWARHGGGRSALSLYDRAFNDGRDLANAYEVRHVMGGSDRALFPGLRMRRTNEGWEGYCSGFTASTIRHPEPVKAVDAGQGRRPPGVVFQPSDIKALLTCIYNRTTEDSYLYLAPPSARDGGPNMGTFHLALANYIGRAGHPIGIDRTKGEASWNNPDLFVQGRFDPRRRMQDGPFTTRRPHDHHLQLLRLRRERPNGPGNRRRAGKPPQTMSLRYTMALDDQGRIAAASVDDSGHSCGFRCTPCKARRWFGARQSAHRREESHGPGQGRGIA